MGLGEDEPSPITEKFLRWRKIKRGNHIVRQYLVTWQNKPLEEAEWLAEDEFEDPAIVEKCIERDQPAQDPSSL